LRAKPERRTLVGSHYDERDVVVSARARDPGARPASGARAGARPCCRRGDAAPLARARTRAPARCGSGAPSIRSPAVDRPRLASNARCGAESSTSAMTADAGEFLERYEATGDEAAFVEAKRLYSSRSPSSQTRRCCARVNRPCRRLKRRRARARPCPPRFASARASPLAASPARPWRPCRRPRPPRAQLDRGPGAHPAP
jgi:hypothetical protein